ncbi:hypothetical protein CcrC1_gp416 [Caulobacter phage C1]|nr:hypothetical protein CcrC1_gp416 [Caulobacter phage C1]UTU08645.1 hypothetical protein CcrC2_gp417 [Caulobacter phage C2]UTU09159.1 hypothetical protein CcrJ4_gp411 [Caulobacter phage J4]UTU10277.1 hypothetical protein CcrRB23_gp415 [Caulobacter phage RB23]WGN97311.1 hypothetical protein [Bertelyvirus sp.]
MTPAMAALLKRLIEADRAYHSRIKSGEMATWAERGVEVGWINGVNPRTAQALADLDLCELVVVNVQGHCHAFLGKHCPYDEYQV